jgi:hypothetical protein
MNTAEPASLLDRWRAVWPQALAAWSSYTLLREPRFLEDDTTAKENGMLAQIAAIRLRDHTVMINVKEVKARDLEDCALAILAHEIGHHIYVPANMTDQGRLIAAIGRMLTGLPQQTVHLAANLYGDLLINDRLQRRANVDIKTVYERLKKTQPSETTSHTWKLYTRTYEHLWRLLPGTIAPPGISEETDADAMLLARVIRSYGGEWLRGARRFAVIVYPYLAKDEEEQKGQTFVQAGLHDTKDASRAGEGAFPDGLSEIDPSELEDDDRFDDDLDDPIEAKKRPRAAQNTAPTRDGPGRPGAQYRAPFEYGALLKSLGLDLSDHEITTRYYRERAMPHLIPFPKRKAPEQKELLAEGYTEWDPGESLEALDWFGSIMRSPRPIPGVTTVQRVYGETSGADPLRVPLDLDIYVDCSGSMPNPAIDVSYLALAGTILAMSALRAGARVQVTLWSSPGVFETTGGFIRDEKRVLGTITGYVSGGTAFPIHILRDTYEARRSSEPPAHIVVISDDGADTMLRKDERGNDGARVAEMALSRARGGGTLVLNLPNVDAWHAKVPFEEIGFRIHAVRAWEELVTFARRFVIENYG